MPATTSKRPYFSFTTDELCKLFEDNKGKRKILLALKAELEHRDRPKAKKLAKRVQDTLDGKGGPEPLPLPLPKPKKPQKPQPLPLPGVADEAAGTPGADDADTPLLRWLKRYREI